MLLRRGSVLAELALDCGRRNAVSSCDLSDALAALTILLDGGTVQDQRSSTDSLAVEPGAPHAGADSLDDQRAFQLSDGSR